MNVLQLILPIILFAIIVIIIYYLLKTYVLPRIKVNKWIVLGVAVLVFFLPVLLGSNLQPGIPAFIQSGLFVILFMWFMDLSGFGGFGSFGKKKPLKKDTIIMRPKAKPNRVKNNK